MHHLAILSPKYHYLEKILDGSKSIESRWYKFRVVPWNKIAVGDRVYFKETSKKVALCADVSEVLQFDHPSKHQIIEIIKKYGRQITAGNFKLDEFYQSVKDKNYIILIFLAGPQEITPFKINKTGFGCSCAWICIDDIDAIKA